MRDTLGHTRATSAKPQMARVGSYEKIGVPEAFGGQRSIQLSYGSSDTRRTIA
jgi:hypothetical protein